MSARRERKILTAGSTPVLKHHVRLQYDPVRDAWSLLSPEKVFWPDEISLDILRLCDGKHTVVQILEILASVYEAPSEEIAADVEGFLQEWSDRSLVTL
jgi:pyrroloquinoline quinone biosynthesis protein D